MPADILRSSAMANHPSGVQWRVPNATERPTADEIVVRLKLRWPYNGRCIRIVFVKGDKTAVDKLVKYLNMTDDFYQYSL